MQINQENPLGAYKIQAHSKEGVTINGTLHSESLCFTPTQIQKIKATHVHELTLKDLEPILKLKPDILVLGTGDELIFPAGDIEAAILQHGIGLEILSNQNACHTTVILASEDRSFATILLMAKKS